MSFKCDECGRSGFESQRALTTHISKAHKKEEKSMFEEFKEKIDNAPEDENQLFKVPVKKKTSSKKKEPEYTMSPDELSTGLFSYHLLVCKMWESLSKFFGNKTVEGFSDEVEKKKEDYIKNYLLISKRNPQLEKIIPAVPYINIGNLTIRDYNNHPISEEGREVINLINEIQEEDEKKIDFGDIFSSQKP